MLLELNEVSKALVALQLSQVYPLVLNKVRYLVLSAQMVLVRLHSST